MQHQRRQYDINDPRHLASYAHERLDKIELLLHKLNRNQIFAAGILAALMFLMQYPQLIKVIQPAEAHSATNTP